MFFLATSISHLHSRRSFSRCTSFLFRRVKCRIDCRIFSQQLRCLGLGHHLDQQPSTVLNENRTFRCKFIEIFCFFFRLLDILRRSSANHFLERIGATGSETFPLLILVTRTRGVLDVLDVIEGRSSPSEVISSLIQAHESFEEQRQHDAEEELLRRNREELKRQQEDEYRLSIAADLEKQRQRENDERKQREEQDANERLIQQRLVNKCFCFFFDRFSFFELFSNNNKNVKLDYPKNRTKQKVKSHS